MNREFRVLPWDFFESPNETAPRVEAIQISGAARRFELLPRGGRVYFRLQDANDERVWATLDDCEELDFRRTFRRAVGSGRIGRVFEHKRKGDYLDCDTRFFLLMDARGEVQCREWCVTNWFLMNSDSPKLRVYLKTRGNKGIFQLDFRPPFRAVLVNSLDLLWEQPFGDSIRNFTRARWLAGDAPTLERWMIPFLPSSSPDLEAGRMVRATFYALMGGKNVQHSAKGHALRPPRDFFPKELEEIFGTCFQMGGVQWEAEHPGDVRRYWHADIPTHHVVIPAEPSAHERLEALFFLRDWLRDKLPSLEIDAILSHVHP